VTHSARATSRACGNTACSPQTEPERPKNSALPDMSATSKQDPSIATNRRPTRNAPDISTAPNSFATQANRSRTGSKPSHTLA